MGAKKANTLWSVHFSKTRKTLEGLTPDQVSAFVGLLANEDLNHVYVWSHEWSDWIPIRQVPDLLKFEGLRAHEKAPTFADGNEDIANQKDEDLINVVERNSDSDNIKTNKKVDEITNIQEGMISDVNDLTLEETNFEYFERQYKRFNKKLKIILECQGRIFETYTKDISTGGMWIMDPLPPFIFGYFTVKIIQPKLNQELVHTCCAVEDQEPTKRHHLAFLPFKKKETEKQFEKWLSAA